MTLNKKEIPILTAREKKLKPITEKLGLSDRLTKKFQEECAKAENKTKMIA